tara:strand:- start:191 stop:919 length:729 start_codon:yes stop_codon:yes gene_type:complete
MTIARRVTQQPGYILHYRPFRDSSQILEIITRDYGKITVVARGSRSKKSRLSGILRPFLPLRVSWSSKSNLGTLTGAESDGLSAGISGDSIFSAYYVNELLLNFLHRYDPQPEIFILYKKIIHNLVGTSDVAKKLRSFELELLKLLGYGVNFDHDSDSIKPLNEDLYYQYQMEKGFVATNSTEGALVFCGKLLIGISEERFEDKNVLKAANRFLRQIIDFHLGGKQLKSRKVLLDLHRNKIV